MSYGLIVVLKIYSFSIISSFHTFQSSVPDLNYQKKREQKNSSSFQNQQKYSHLPQFVCLSNTFTSQQVVFITRIKIHLKKLHKKKYFECIFISIHLCYSSTRRLFIQFLSFLFHKTLKQVLKLLPKPKNRGLPYVEYEILIFFLHLKCNNNKKNHLTRTKAKKEQKSTCF